MCFLGATTTEASPADLYCADVIATTELLFLASPLYKERLWICFCKQAIVNMLTGAAFVMIIPVIIQFGQQHDRKRSYINLEERRDAAGFSERKEVSVLISLVVINNACNSRSHCLCAFPASLASASVASFPAKTLLTLITDCIEATDGSAA